MPREETHGGTGWLAGRGVEGKGDNRGVEVETGKMDEKGVACKVDFTREGFGGSSMLWME